VIEAEPPDETTTADAHGMDPVKVLALARTLGSSLPRTFVVGCEPQTRMTGEEDEIVAQLSEPVRAALDPAVRLVQSLLADIRAADIRTADIRAEQETHPQEVPRR
jgi:hypothetical protein